MKSGIPSLPGVKPRLSSLDWNFAVMAREAQQVLGTAAGQYVLMVNPHTSVIALCLALCDSQGNIVHSEVKNTKIMTISVLFSSPYRTNYKAWKSWCYRHFQPVLGSAFFSLAFEGGRAIN